MKFHMFVVYSQTDRHEVYMWGDNANFTLGQVKEHRLQTPEVIDEFRKKCIQLKQVRITVGRYFFFVFVVHHKTKFYTGLGLHIINTYQ